MHLDVTGLDVQRGKAVARFLPAAPTNIVYSCDSMQGRIVFFDYRTSTVMRSFELSQSVCSLSVSMSGSLLAAGGSGASLYLVDVVSMSWSELKGHLHSVQSLCFNSDSSCLASAAGATVMQWSVTAV